MKTRTFPILLFTVAFVGLGILKGLYAEESSVTRYDLEHYSAYAADGDTLHVVTDGYLVDRIHLWGYDPPQGHEDKARRALAGLLSGHVLVCEVRGQEADYDVQQCWTGGQDLSAEMVRLGYGVANSDASSRVYGGRLARMEREAREAKRGVWAD